MEIRKAERGVALNRARMINPSLFDRLMSHADTSSPDDCWLWDLSKDKDGYGFFKVDGKNVKAHRAVHSLFRPLEPAPVVRHLCNNPGCINPLHLRAGTQKENAADRVAHGRGGDLKGESNGRAKLTAQQALGIRSSTEAVALLASRYCVSKVMISRIRRGLAWSHLSITGE